MITQFFAKATTANRPTFDNRNNANANGNSNGNGSGSISNGTPGVGLRGRGGRHASASPIEKSSIPPPLSSPAVLQAPSISSRQAMPHESPPPKPASSSRKDSNSSHPHTYPYPFAIRSSPTPHPAVTIDPILDCHIHQLSLITGVLLPVRYSRSFYTATMNDPVIHSLSRVAVYRNPGVAAASASNASSPDAKRRKLCLGLGFTETDKVIGSIRCKIAPAGTDANGRTVNQLYIQTLGLLAPFRGYGVATAMLDSILYETPPVATTNTTASSTSTKRTPSGPVPTATAPGPKSCPRRLSSFVRHYNIGSVMAHVHTSNDDALAWYVARGFEVQPGIIDGYYRRLSPSSARIVYMKLGREDGVQNRDKAQAQEAGEGGDYDAISLIEPPSDAGETRTAETAAAATGEEEEDNDWERVDGDDPVFHDASLPTPGK